MKQRMRANARRLIVPAVVDGLLVAAFATTMLTIGGAALDATAMVSLFFGGTIVAIAGSVIVIWTVGDAHPSHHAMAILLGSLATSLVVLFGCMTTGTLAATVFLVWSGVVLAAGAWTLRSAPIIERSDGLDVLAFAAIAILVVARCHDAAATLPSIQATGIAPVWSDYSIHATEIAQFGDPHVRTLSSFLLAGQPLVFYHYASYMLPAAAAGVVSLPPWGVATSLLLPCGILLMSLAVYAFARTRLGTMPAMIAPAALLLIPDASAYGLRNGFFGFHWMVFAAPGSGYGLSAAFTALALVEIWRARQRTACLWLGLFVMVSAFEFRAHIFLLLAPAMAAALLCETTIVRRHARIVSFAAALTLIIVVIGLGTWQSARDAWLRFSVPRQFLELVHTGISPTAYEGSYKAIDGRYGPLVGTTLGLLALIPAALGAFAIALPVAGAAAVRRTGWRSLDTFPIWCVTAWVGLVLLAPTANFDYTELKQRPFVLVYAAAVVWTLLFVERALPAARSSARGLRVAVSAAAAAGIATAALAGRNDDPGRPRFDSGIHYFGAIVDRRIIDAAAFVRTQAAVGDTFAVIPSDPADLNDDDATRLAALAGVPAYLARAGIHARTDERRRLVVEQRLSELQRVATASDPNVAFGALRTMGVDFLINLGDGGASFDPSGSRAAFRTSGATVYQIGPER